MASLPGPNGVSEATVLHGANLNTIKTSVIPRFVVKRTGVFSQLRTQASNGDGFPVNITRRAALGVAVVTFSGQLKAGILLADDGNRYWINGPIPVPPVYNKIANEETGTRSFLKKGIYMANVGPEGSAYRLRQYAFDLLALEDLLDKDAWSYVRKYLRLKSTVMYYDFDKVISAAPVDEKQPLTALANKLFNNVEKLEDAVKMRSLTETESCYQDTRTVLQEVMDRMA